MKTTRTLETPQLRSRTFAAAFAAALITGLSAASSFAQGYYPPNNSPIDGNPNLQAIESRLGVGASLIVPTPAGKHLATDAEIALALGTAITDELDGTPVGGGVSLSGLVNEISKYRPAKTGNWATTAVTKVLAEPTTANIPDDLETVSAAASAPNPKGAPGVVKNAIKLIATVGSTTDVNASDITENAIEQSVVNTAKIVAAAMGSLKKADVADVSNIQQDIVSDAVKAAVAGGAGYLIDEITFAAAKGRAASVSSSDIAAAAFRFRPGSTPEPGGDDVGPTGVPLTNFYVGLAEAGALRGAGVAEAANVETGVNAGSSNGFTAYVAQVKNGYLTASTSSDSTVSAPAVLASINAGNKDFIPAIMQGAVAWLNRNDTGLLGGATGALRSDESLGGAASVSDIVEAVVGGVQKDAAKIALSALSAVDAGITVHDIAHGAARGADASLIGAVTKTMIKGGAINQANVEGIVDGAIAGAVATGKNGAIVDVAFQASKAGGGAGLSDEATVQAVLSSPAGDAYRAVAGGVAGNKKSNAAIKTAALAARGDDDDVANGLAADTVIAIQLSPKTFFNTTLSKLTDASNTMLIDTQAIVTGAGIANPKGATAIASAAIANTSFSTAEIIAAAKQTNRKQSFNIDLATNAAIHAKADTSDLFDYVNHTVFQNPKFSADIATGAAIAAPKYAHVVGHAAAFAAPANAGKMVPSLYAFSQLDNHLAPNIDNGVAAAAAISAGVTCGILEAKTGAKEKAYLIAAVSASVKAVIVLQGNGSEGLNNFKQSDGASSSSFTLTTQKGAAGVVSGYVAESVDVGQTDIPGGAGGTVGAVITAAIKADKKDALAIVQAAVTAAASISGAPGAYVGAGIVGAAAAAGVTAGVSNAVAFGRSEAVAGKLGAGAAGVSAVANYSHHTATGAPVTSIFDL